MSFYVCLLLFTVFHAVLCADELIIEPSVDRLFVTDGKFVTLTCSVNLENTSAGVSPTVNWVNKRPNTDGDEPGTIQIDKFSVDDHAGVYTCEYKSSDGSSTMSKNITLTGITESKTTPELEFTDKNFILTEPLACNISVSQESLKVSGPQWFKNMTSIKELDDTRFKEFKDQNMLEIINPIPTDLGVYIAEYVISDGQKNTVYKCQVEISSLPSVERRQTGCKNVIEGKKVDLQCNVYGYPKPVITWYKDNQHVNITQGSSKIMLKPVNGYKDAHLMIDSADFEDSGNYRCVAVTKSQNASVSQEICVGVKDKHAALWPFLAIVCEVLVLCAIIFVYEKKRNDKAKAAERDAQDTPNTEVKGKVRNRRQQSS